MRYCARCLYPENAKPAIIFDDEGICSGCRYHESRSRIDWEKREAVLRDFLILEKQKAREAGQKYDCIIPVSGGKDSHYQVHLIKNIYGLNPLLVTFNHCYNTPLGVRNLRNMVKKFRCDLIRFSANLESVRKISRYMLKTVGDLTWHYHAGIRTLPFQVAVQYNIPLIIWGEHGFAELTGMFTLEDMVEFTKWTRQEHDMRGYEPHDLITPESGITEQDLAPYIYPSDDQIEALDVRGIYLSNYVYWNAKEHAQLVIDKYDFKPYAQKREKTFLLYGKIEDHANDVHDYLKYLKFGYGRATDDASMEIRHGRMTRQEGIRLVEQYDAVKPSTLQQYLNFLDVTEEEFYSWITPMRDTDIWTQDSNGQWIASDSVINHREGADIATAAVELVVPENRTFSRQNRHLYYSEEHWSGSEVDDSAYDSEYGFLSL